MYRVLSAYCLLLLCVCTVKVLGDGCPHAARNLHKKKQAVEDEAEKLKKTIGSVISMIDADNDGKTTVEELSVWTKKSLKSVYKRESKERAKSLDTNKDDKVTWEEYLKSTEDIGAVTEEQKRRRFNHADADKDESLSHDEITSMFHPEEKPHMYDVIVEEYLEKADTNKDGFLSLDEYKDKLSKGDEASQKAAEGFFKLLDKNHDDNIDREEIKLWLVSVDTTSLGKHQAQQLVTKADDNKDGTLSEDEILNHIDLFAPAHAGAEAKGQKSKEKAKDVKDEL